MVSDAVHEKASRPMRTSLVWKTRIRRATLFFLITATAWAYLWYPKYSQEQRMQKRTEMLRLDILELQSEIEYNRERIALLKYDPVTIETEIRRNLRWVRAGELPAEINN